MSRGVFVQTISVRTSPGLIRASHHGSSSIPRLASHGDFAPQEFLMLVDAQQGPCQKHERSRSGGKPSVETRVVRRLGEQMEKRTRCAHDIFPNRIGRFHFDQLPRGCEDKPGVLLDFLFELAGGPARVAGEDAKPVAPSSGLCWDKKMIVLWKFGSRRSGCATSSAPVRLSPAFID